MIIDHVGVAISDYETSRRFYCAALAPLGIRLIGEVHGWAGFGRAGKPEFWFATHPHPPRPLHIAFLAENRQQVRAFHTAALAAGAKDNGPPGIREHFHSNYYGAFVLDPDGHNIEAVCHQAET